MNNKKQQTEITEDKNNTAGNTGDSPIHTSVEPIGNSIISDAEKTAPKNEIKKQITY